MAEITLLSKFSLFVLGLLVGAISPTFGIGGGLVTVPILILFFGMDGNIATATSLGLIVFTTLSGTIAYYVEKRIDFKLAGIFMLFAVPGTLLGGYGANFIARNNYEIDILQFVFAAFMIVIAGSKLISIVREFKNKNKRSPGCDFEVADNTNNEDGIRDPESFWKSNIIYREFMDQRKIRFKYEVTVFPNILVAFIGGLFGSLLGLGGGIIYVPVLTMLMGVPIGIAAATSTFTILISSILPIILRFEYIQWEYVIFLALGTVISASVVPKFVCKVQSEKLLLGFWIIVAVTALRLLINVIIILT
jgi:hypothetical protein